MKIILIRHGLTDYNLQKRYCGFKDIGLNKIGKAQAKRIKTKLRGLKIDNIFCSDLKRTQQTAKIIFGNRCTTVKTPKLREINFGIWEGLDFRETLKRYPSIYKRWVKNPFSVNIPKGERIGSFITRVRKELRNIIKHNPLKTVVIISHAGTMRIILNDCLKVKRKDFWKVEIEPQAIYIIEYNSHLKPKVYCSVN